MCKTRLLLFVIFLVILDLPQKGLAYFYPNCEGSKVNTTLSIVSELLDYSLNMTVPMVDGKTVVEISPSDVMKVRLMEEVQGVIVGPGLLTYNLNFSLKKLNESNGFPEIAVDSIMIKNFQNESNCEAILLSANGREVLGVVVMSVKKGMSEVVFVEAGCEGWNKMVNEKYYGQGRFPKCNK